jgi:hypothetical protein
MVDFRIEYLAVLRNEVATLQREYYKPNEEGTGHFNTAISVLKQRIGELENGKPIQIHSSR